MRRRPSGGGAPTFKWEPQTYLASVGSGVVYTQLIPANTYVGDRIIESVATGCVLGSSSQYDVILATGAPGSEVPVFTATLATTDAIVGRPFALPIPIRLPAGTRLAAQQVIGVNTTATVGHRSVSDLRRMGVSPARFPTSVARVSVGGGGASGNPGAWGQVWAAGAGPSGTILVVGGSVYNATSASAARMEFGIGASGSEVGVSVPQPMNASPSGQMFASLATPFVVPSGARLACRAYDNVGSTMNLTVLYYVSPTTPGYALR